MSEISDRAVRSAYATHRRSGERSKKASLAKLNEAMRMLHEEAGTETFKASWAEIGERAGVSLSSIQYHVFDLDYYRINGTKGRSCSWKRK